MKIEEVLFDTEDRNLFLINDDLQLKADAIRYSILPKLEIVENEIISRVAGVYDFDFFENCIIGKSPQFRKSQKQRTKDLAHNYENSSVWMYGQRTKNKWKGLERTDNKEAQITPTLLGVDLCSSGIKSFLHYGYVKNFSVKTHRKFYEFVETELVTVLSLVNQANCTYISGVENIISIDENLRIGFDRKQYDISFLSKPLEYPITYEKINDIIYSNLLLFPIFNAFLCISLGIEPTLTRDVKKLEQEINRYHSKYTSDEADSSKKEIEPLNLDTLKEKAETKLKVQAGIRWQVFKRDKWRCLACGRSAEENAILHIDHIVPRSKGGEK